MSTNKETNKNKK